MGKKVSLKVNGQDIPMNPFVKDIVSNVVKGLVDSLDKIPGDKNHIEIKIEEEDNK